MPKWTVIVIATVVLLLLPPATSASPTSELADRMSWSELAKAAKMEVRRGGIYSQRWGHASPWLRRLSAELVERAFTPYGTQAWARYIVHRESGENPGAVNTTYSEWEEQARCLMQAIPKYHTWVNYKRCVRDPAYAVRVFVRMSRGGSHTSPWNL